MISLVCAFCLLFSIVMPISALENKERVLVEKYDNFEVFIVYDDINGESIVTYENNCEIYRSFYKEDGNVYQVNSKGEETLAIEVEVDLSQIEENLIVPRAPSQFYLVNQSNAVKFTINGNVVDAGKTAIRNAIIGFGLGFFQGGTAGAIAGASTGALGALVDYIWSNGETYTTNIIRKYYLYSGCDWLMYSELVYPTGQTIGFYSWKDNPQLGIAPYVCKLASQTYPY